MKKFLIIFAAISLCGTTNAQSITETLSGMESILGKRDQRLKIDLDTRMDLRYLESNGDTDYSNFHLQNMRLIVTGEIVPGIRYRWRQRLNKSTAANPDGSGEATDHIWVAFDLGRQKNWTVTAGKQMMQLGTFEFHYNGADTYLNTITNADFANTRIGVNTAYRFAGQAINLQVMNAGSQMTDDGHSTRGLAAAAMWDGSLIEGALNTRIGYAVFQNSSSKIYQGLTAGLQINTGVITTELDFYRGERMMDYSQVITERTGRHHIRDMSAAANIKVAHGKWRPAVKGIWDRRRDMELKSDAYENLGIQTLLEYFPFPEGLLKDLRFHAMYSYKHTSPEGVFSNGKSGKEHTALVGMRWIIPIK